MGLIRSCRRFLHTRDPEEMRRMVVAANVHLHFCIELYHLQMGEGRYFLHEHPDKATSWRHPKMTELLRREGVMRLVGHMCRHGMTARDQDGEGLVLKPTGWLTNA